MRKTIFLLITLITSSLSFAADLEERLSKARADKAVAEQPNGYLKVVTASPDIQSLVDEVNAKRKQKYQEVTAQTPGSSLQAVEQSAGQKLMEKYK